MNINGKVNIQAVEAPEMILKEGIFANDTILTKDELKALIEPQWNRSYRKKGREYLNNIKTSLIKNEKRKVYVLWSDFQKEMLFNTTETGLLVIADVKNLGDPYEYKYNPSESEVMSDSGRLRRLTQLSKQLFIDSITEEVDKHLRGFMEDIQNKTLNSNQIHSVIDKLFNNKTDIQIEENKSYTYQYVFYGGNPQWRGNAMDAFMNHVGHKHASLFTNIPIQGEIFDQSVMAEEKTNVLKLLADSRNNTAWYTGGDIIVRYKDETFNIQLKTSLQSLDNRKQVGGRLTIKNFSSLIDELEKDFIKTGDLEKYIDDLYNNLKTSGWVENVAGVAAEEFLDDAFEGMKWD